MRESNWIKIEVCEKCYHYLSTNSVYFSNGRCPKCGEKSGCTIVNTKEVVFKVVKHHKWYQLFNRKTEFIGYDQFSIDWMKSNWK